MNRFPNLNLVSDGGTVGMKKGNASGSTSLLTGPFLFLDLLIDFTAVIRGIKL
jgi:hypothetical protein